MPQHAAQGMGPSPIQQQPSLGEAQRRLVARSLSHALRGSVIGATAGLTAGVALMLSSPVVAQQGQTFMRNKNQPVVTPQTSVEPRNCQQSGDGTIRCDTQLVNPQDPANRYRTVESPSSR